MQNGRSPRLPVSPAGQVPGPPWLDARLTVASGYSDMSEGFAGCTFENGLYRVHDAVSGPEGETLIEDAFPGFAERACPFGYDWLGRQFAVDSERLERGEPLILLMEPGTGQALEVPFAFGDFHERITERRELAFAASFFNEWASANPASIPLEATECVGYRVPLFLGGKDQVENLEVIDLDVYWSLCGQLRARTTELPKGPSIRQVSIGD